MELGEKIRAARQEAGLSQRALCGDRITRNMLSQIENGSARPSMATLEYLAAGLGKPISYFLEEEAVSLPNLPVIRKAREQYTSGMAEAALETLRSYREGDETFDSEYYLLLSLCCVKAAEQAAEAGKNPYSETLLTRSLAAGEKTPYPTLRHEALALRAWLKREDRESFKAQMEALKRELSEGQQDRFMLLFARWSLLEGKSAEARFLLGKVREETPERDFLLGESYLAERDYARAAEAFLRAERLLETQGGSLRPVYEKLELCFRELEDYKMAYFYAAKQK